MTTLLILAIIPCCIPLIEARIINIRLGPVEGVHIAANPSANAPIPIPVDVYFGIPFAKAPVGDLRFRPPQPITQSWSSPLQATRQPPKCVSPSGGQEDCLYLNVFAPSTPSSRPRPVMMWIYGGGYVYGNVGNYDATSLASCEDVIVVMGNYRLGALGFYSNEATMKESGTTGNWGLLDQVATMEWIQENIHAFGGDPARVSIFGESAGAMSVIAHMVSPRSEGLFSSAIIQSGTTHVDMFFQPREDAEKYNEWLAKIHLNCPGGIEDMECLRRIPASRFPIRYQERDGWGAPTWGNPIFPLFHSAPVIDGVFLPASPIVIMKDRASEGKAVNSFATIPVIIGTTQDEGSIFVTQLPFIIRPVVDFPPREDQLVDTIDYIIHDRSLAEEIFNENYPKFKDAYPPQDEWKFATAEFQFISSMIRDVMFACPTTTFADLLFKAGYEVFMYNFGYKFWPDVSRGFPIGQILGRLGNMTVDHIGTFHSSDVPFVMKLFYSRNVTLDEIGLDTPHALYLSPMLSQPGDLHHKVSDFMSCSWANLARCGNVVCEGVRCTDHNSTTWTPYTSQTMQYLSIGPNGSQSMETFPASGEVGVDAHYPSMEKCLWYRDKIQTPFHDLRADLRLIATPGPRGMRADEATAMSDKASMIPDSRSPIILTLLIMMSLI